MGFELQVKPVPPKLAEAFNGASVELREIPWLAVREAMSNAGARGLASEGLLAASMHINGEPIGLEALLAMPGRFTGALGQAMMICHRMHGLVGDEPEDDAAAEGDAAPKH